jgi:glycosyltransferase involved in cell wall biosynthesis
MLEGKRVALVVQRYGEEVNGGAEMLARWLAERLAKMIETHVITTCALDYHTWDNVYAPGESVLNGVRVLRFAVDEPRHPDFARRTVALFEEARTLFDEYQWMKDQGPYSTDLFNYIHEARDFFDLFIFVTYLYPPTFFGLPQVSDKAILIPNAHDEPYLRLPIMRSLFHMPQMIVYNTETEKSLVNSVMHNHYVPQTVAGVGINVPDNVSAERFRQKYRIDGSFVVYVGRVDSAKNVPELLDQFARFRDETGRDTKLVLIGKSSLELPARADIIPLGFVSEEDKFDAICAADVLLMPSLYESLSLVAMEAWLMGVPTLVNAQCEVLKSQTRRSNGGLYYYSYDEFAGGLQRLLDDAALRAQLGRQGRAFVAANYSWEVIMAKYRAILETLIPRPVARHG